MGRIFTNRFFQAEGVNDPGGSNKQDQKCLPTGFARVHGIPVFGADFLRSNPRCGVLDEEVVFKRDLFLSHGASVDEGFEAPWADIAAQAFLFSGRGRTLGAAVL